ncbi:CIC11C00000000164 [Sungouiella intermedia]|uniref:CIC11C00000000164 n=1 Tax=Sungouiella intermedia TaxID=45354 RepID=A0A1L0D896_9ASCO|nr:CIC11C00000004135 [[Candida] intermedia]SGZ52472.1 CIC11C00000000164 [[Candida] intermedia]
MSLDPQSLQKLLIEMDNQLNKSRAELSMCNVQLDRVDTNLKIIDATTSRLNKLTSPGDHVWKGVGKAFVQNDAKEYIEDINKDKKEFLETQKLLKTKKHYLETTLEKTIANMTEIVGKK